MLTLSPIWGVAFRAHHLNGTRWLRIGAFVAYRREKKFSLSRLHRNTSLQRCNAIPEGLPIWYPLVELLCMWVCVLMNNHLLNVSSAQARSLGWSKQNLHSNFSTTKKREAFTFPRFQQHQMPISFIPMKFETRRMLLFSQFSRTITFNFVLVLADFNVLGAIWVSHLRVSLMNG